MEDFQNSLITASNAASMLRRRVTPNEGQLSKTVIERNNARVDEFENLLKEVGDMNNKVPASLVWHYWQVFEQGCEIENLVNLECKMNEITDDNLEYWKEVFSTYSMEDLYDLGISLVTYGWSMVILPYIKQWLVRQKYEKVYSQTDDRAEWLRLSREHRKLWEANDLPFWDNDKFQEVNEKVRVISSTRVRPRT